MKFPRMSLDKKSREELKGYTEIPANRAQMIKRVAWLCVWLLLCIGIFLGLAYFQIQDTLLVGGIFTGCMIVLIVLLTARMRCEKCGAKVAVYENSKKNPGHQDRFHVCDACKTFSNHVYREGEV